MEKKNKRNSRGSKLYNEDFKDFVEIPRTKKVTKSFFTKADIDKSNIILSGKQMELYKMIRNNTLTVCQGPPGSSKTYTTCYTALCLLAEQKIGRIVITKPIQEAGENLGFLPGDIKEKTDPFAQSFYSNFEKIIGGEMLKFLRESEMIVFEPLAYMRGITLDNCLMILDEDENATLKQLMLWTTRIGENTKAVMLGDQNQYDIRKADVKINDFIEYVVKGVEGVSVFEFTKEDIVRNKFLIDIVDNYGKFLSKTKS